MEKERVAYFDYARVFAIISISLNHAVNRTFDNYEDTQAEFLSMEYSLQVIKASVSVFSRIGVPIFLMLTGALILSKKFETKEDVRRFYIHNWLRLVIAVEIWLAIYFWFIYYYNPEPILRDLLPEELHFKFISTLLFIDQTSEGLMWYMNMIIPLYTLLPVFAVFVNKGYLKYLWGPVAFTLFVTVVVYDYTRYLSLTYPEDIFTTHLYAPLTYFSVYVIGGYAISKGKLSDFPWIVVLAVNVALFYVAVKYQLFFYESPSNALVSYDSVPLMLCAFTTFELFRRADGTVMQWFGWVMAHLSRHCLGVFFVHIIIMELLNWTYDFTGMDLVRKMIFLEVVSLVGAFIIVEVLSLIGPIRKHLFLVK